MGEFYGENGDDATRAGGAHLLQDERVDLTRTGSAGYVLHMFQHLRRQRLRPDIAFCGVLMRNILPPVDDGSSLSVRIGRWLEVRGTGLGVVIVPIVLILLTAIAAGRLHG
jgi:hypothetical protein